MNPSSEHLSSTNKRLSLMGENTSPRSLSKFGYAAKRKTSEEIHLNPVGRNSIFKINSNYELKLKDPNSPTHVLFPRKPNKNKTVSFNSKVPTLGLIQTKEEIILKQKEVTDCGIEEIKQDLPNNPFNYEVPEIIDNTLENDIDSMHLSRLLNRNTENEKFKLVATGLKMNDSQFYRVFSLKEMKEEEEEDDSSENRELNKKEEHKQSIAFSKQIIEPITPKKEIQKITYTPNLIEDIFGKEKDSSSSSSSDKNPNSFSEANSIQSINYKKNKIKLLIDENENKKNERKKYVYNYLQDFFHPTLDNRYDEIDSNIEENTKLKKEITAIPQLFRQNTRFLVKRKPEFLKVSIMNPIEKIHIDYDLYPDKYPLNKLRKYCMLLFRYFQKGLELILKHKFFEFVSFSFIFLNCITYILLRNKLGMYNQYINQIKDVQFFVFIFYLTEMSMKLIVYGAFCSKGCYFHNYWNCLDFFINIGLILFYTDVFVTLDLSLLRSLRILKPIKDVTAFNKLQTILQALFSAFPLLLDTFIILIFFFLLYAIAGLQLFSGVLKYRCMEIETGILGDEIAICGNLQCKDYEVCAKGIANPYKDMVNFDDLPDSFLQVILTITLDYWTAIMYYIQKSVTNYAWIYFVSLVIMGNYILINLTLAVIKVKFSEAHSIIINEKDKPKKKKIQETYDFSAIKRNGLWFKKNAETVKKNRIPEIVTINAKSLNNNTDDSKNSSLQKNNSAIKHYESRHSKSPLLSKAGTLQKRKLSTNRMSLLQQKDSKVFSKLSSSSNVSNRKESFSKLERPSLTSNLNFDYEQQQEGNFFQRNLKKTMQTITDFNISLKKNLSRFLNYNKNRRKKNIHINLLKIKPKYLKLVIDHDKEIEALSLNDVLPHREEIKKKKEIEQEMSVVKRAKLPIIYTARKRSNMIMDLFKKVYQKTGSMSTEIKSESSLNDFLNLMHKKPMKGPQVNNRRNGTKPLALNHKISKNLERLKTLKSIKNPNNNNNENIVITLKNQEYKQKEIIGNSPLTKSPRRSMKDRLTTIINPIFNNKTLNMKDHFEVELNKMKKEKIFTKEQEILFSLVLGKRKDIDYQLYQILINAAIENDEDDDNISLNKYKMDESLDMEKFYLKIRRNDYQAEKIFSYAWSGEDVLKTTFNLSLFEKIFESLNKNDLQKYIEECKGKFKILKKNFRKIVENKFYIHFFNFIIMSHIFLISLEGIIPDNGMILLNIIYLAIFFVEFLIKLTSYSIKYYLNDPQNKIDLLIILLSSIEIILIEKEIELLFRYVRFLTAMKILRVSRIFKNLKFVHLILKILSKTLSTFIYLAILLILIIFVYALVGMQLFGGLLSKENASYNIFNFDSFWVSFITVFDIITLDNYIEIISICFKSDTGPYITSIFVISFIFIGNFVLLNLFLAILLDGFTQSLEEEEKGKIVDEEHKEIDQEEMMENIMNHKELKIIIPKNAQETFIDEMTRQYLKYVQINPRGSNSRDTQLLSELIVQTRKISEKGALNINPLQNIPCEFSFFLFNRDNYFRKKIFKILNLNMFKNMIIITIFLSCCIHIFETHLDKNSNEIYDRNLVILTKIVNFCFMFIFFIEIMMKSIVYGFCLNKKSVLRNNMNILDALIIFSYIVDLILYDDDMSSFDLQMIIRSIRILRPLRFISIFTGLNLVVNALIESIPSILNVSLLLIVFWLTYGILGIILYRDRFGYCKNRLNFSVGRSQCSENDWINYRYNFDNIINAVITLFIISTYDDWNEIMNVAINSESAELGPVEFNNQYTSYIYFLTFIIFGVMFLINLFIGVIFYNFSVASKRTKHKFLTDSQYYWIQLQKYIIYAEPQFIANKPPSNTIKTYIYNIVQNKFFNFFINISIVLNIIVLALQYDGAPFKYSSAINYIHMIFNIIFVFEACLKIFAIGFWPYFHSRWNKFDFFVVITAFCDLMVQYYIDDFLKLIRLGDQIIKGIRVIRVVRLMKLIRQNKGVEKLLYTLMISLPMVINICVLLVLIYYVFIIFGCNRFKKIVKGNAFNDYVNFKNSAYATMTLFRVSTADAWGYIMFDAMDQTGSAVSAIYFIFFFTITSYILINFFVLVLLQQFESYSLDPNNPLYTFSDYLDRFRINWSLYTFKYKGLKMDHRSLVNFLIALKSPLGFNKNEDIDIILREISKMRLTLDSKGFLYFNEMLFCTLRRTYENQILIGQNELSLKEIEQTEETSRTKLQLKKKQKNINDAVRASVSTQTKFTEKLIQLNILEYNPLPLYYITKMAFYTLRRYSEITMVNLDKDLQGDLNFTENITDSDDDDSTIKKKQSLGGNKNIHYITERSSIEN